MKSDSKENQFSEKPIVILGAGPAGLGAAYWIAKANRNVIVLEKEPRVGGMCASQRIKDYIVDYGPHTFHLKKTHITQLFERLAGNEVNKVRRNAKLWIDGRLLPFPLQVSDVLWKLSPVLSSRILLDYLKEKIFCSLFPKIRNEVISFEDYGTRNFGKTLYRLAFGDYSEKMWGVSGSQLSAKLAKQKLVGLSLWKLILSTVGILNTDQADAMGLSSEKLYDAYPRYGIGTFFEALADEIRSYGGKIYLNTTPYRIELFEEKIAGICYHQNGKDCNIEASALLSSIPITELTQLLYDKQFERAKMAASNLSYRSLIVVNLVIDKEKFADAHWIYLLDPSLFSNRLSEQKNLSKDSCPPGKTVVTLDITCNYQDYLWNSEDSFLIALTIHDLSSLGLHPRTILDAFVMRAKDVYPVYSLKFEENMNEILENLSQCSNLYSMGRHGLLLNNDMHDSIEMGFLAAKTMLGGESSSNWYTLSKKYVQERLEGIIRDPIEFKE
ncbi:FAD-dependent oxidoreductase [Candidatus Parcubacteria bacterium]|nr:MAG: FAD-dependent oxidoreductase [Candidatus Parcubacteria bacterium]